MFKETDLCTLDDLLVQGKWKQANRYTGQLIHSKLEKITGKNTFMCEIVDYLPQFSQDQLKIIDNLWVNNSNKHFGFSIQKIKWSECYSEDTDNFKMAYQEFCQRIGWIKGNRYLENTDLDFSLNAPQGHLPELWGGSWLVINMMFGHAVGHGFSSDFGDFTIDFISLF
ncbi:MAG: GUN4 domain-containing protein [Limnospira sp. PMC 1291.21]|uniref:Putative GUN4-like regulator n=1 Tax=Arthrospira sp. SRM16 TaxID=1929211 RepID=A0A4Y7LM62_9CYAN